MKANELRVSNLVYDSTGDTDEDKIVKVYSVAKRGEVALINGIRSTYFQPIPLTEEHFKKWEFELIKFVAPNQECGIDLFYGYDYAIKKIGNKTDLIIRYKDGKFKLDDFYSTDFKYVHTFQNFYQSLAGQEL